MHDHPNLHPPTHLQPIHPPPPQYSPQFHPLTPPTQPQPLPQAWQRQWEAGGGDEEARAAAALDEACRCVEALGEQFYPNDNRWMWLLFVGWLGDCRQRVGVQRTSSSQLSSPALPPAFTRPKCRRDQGCFHAGLLCCSPALPSPPHPPPQLPSGPRADAARAGGGGQLAAAHGAGAGQPAPAAGGLFWPAGWHHDSMHMGI